VRVAIVKLSSLGDVVHALPVAAALRAQFPRAHLTWVVERRESALLQGNPALDEVAVADTRGWRRRRGLRAMAESMRAFRGLRRRLRDTRFDVALDLQGNLKSGVLTAVTGAAVRVGFAAGHCRESLNTLFTNRRINPPASAHHVVDQQLSLLAAVGVQGARPHFWLPDDPEAGRAIDDFIARQGLDPADRIVVLNPGAGRETKRWPAPGFAEVARRLRAEASAAVLVLWGPAERHHAEVIAGGSGAVLAPPTDLHGLLALLRRARMMVAADTGPLHLAAALGVPCVGLYGPTDPARNGPYGRGHRVVRGPDGTMASVSTEAVLAAVRALLEGAAPPAVPSG
jgi:lipopolysaccharide heptosyltransferase I